MLIDVHAHYEDTDMDAVCKKAENAGVRKIINAATNHETSVKCLEISRIYSNVYCVLGVHPEYAYEPDMTEFITEAARTCSKVVGIGETGLDYQYLPKDDPEECARIKEAQKNNFISHIKLSEKLGLPLVVHDRDAHEDTLSLLRDNVSGNTESVLHCYSGSAESVRDLAALNFSFSVGGVLTFKNARRLVEAVRAMPKERILLETDSPYLTPEPFRGRPNDSSFMVYTAHRLAEILGMTYDDICRITTENAMRIFSRMH